MAISSDSTKIQSGDKDMTGSGFGGTMTTCKIAPGNINAGKIKVNKIRVKEILIEGHYSTAYIKIYTGTVTPVPFDPQNPGTQMPPAVNGIYTLNTSLIIEDPCAPTGTAMISLRVHHIFTPQGSVWKQELCEVIPLELECPIAFC